MPNWCSNKLTITGPTADVEAFKAKAVGHSPWSEPKGEPDVLNFHSLVPIPDEVLRAGYGEAGFDWERANWGCKWGADNSMIVEEWEGHVEYSFETAWSPPIKILENVAKQWPNLTFVLIYEELGVGYKGISKFKGDTKEDHCISL